MITSIDPITYIDPLPYTHNREVASFSFESERDMKESILSWFRLSREDRRKFVWENSGQMIYRMLLPEFYDDINLNQILICEADMNEKFNKFFASVFRLKRIAHENIQEQINFTSMSTFRDDYTANDGSVYNLNETFLFNLDTEIKVKTLTASKYKNEDKNRNTAGEIILQPWKRVNSIKVEYDHQVKLSQVYAQQNPSIMCADNEAVERFRLEILKEDLEIKSKFMNQHLFSGLCLSYPSSSISIERMKRGTILPYLEDKIQIVYEGSVIEEEVNGKDRKSKFGLICGSIIWRNKLKSLIDGKVNEVKGKENICKRIYKVETDSVLIVIGSAEIIKIVKNEKLAKNMLLQKLVEIDEEHSRIIAKSENVQTIIKESENVPIELFYPIPRSTRQTRAFRKTAHTIDNTKLFQINLPDDENVNFEEFITYDRYEKISRNKELVERKHLVYANMSNKLREKEKQERFMKKMGTEKGLREIKRCEYLARLKQNKIENMAIKNSIVNTEKYRERSHDVRFIFDEEMMEKYMKENKEVTCEKSGKRKVRKWISMVVEIDDEKRSERKALTSKQNENETPTESAKSIVKKIRPRHESSPNLETILPKQRKESCFKSTFDLKQKVPAENNYNSNANLGKENRWL